MWGAPSECKTAERKPSYPRGERAQTAAALVAAATQQRVRNCAAVPKLAHATSTVPAASTRQLRGHCRQMTPASHSNRDAHVWV